MLNCAPASNACWLLARDHAAPESTLALAKAASLGRGRVRPLAWCSRPRNSTASLEGALQPSVDVEEAVGHPLDVVHLLDVRAPGGAEPLAFLERLDERPQLLHEVVLRRAHDRNLEAEVLLGLPHGVVVERQTEE